jgi:hypothetical protein
VSDDVGGGALDSVKEAFQGKRGKVLLIGGGAAVAAYVWWTRRNGSADTTTTDTTDTTDTAVDGPSGRTPQTDPEVGDTTTPDTTGGRKYSSNADWLADGTSFLQGRGTPAANAYDALTKALAGNQLTAQQIAWVSQVISALGAPPEGMPPLNAGAPAGTPTTAMKAPTGLKVTNTTTSQIAVDWTAVSGAKGYRAYVNGKQNGNTVVYSNTNLRYLSKGKAYKITVRAVYPGDKLGPLSAAITGKTKSK